jgi:hypothetical protein
MARAVRTPDCSSSAVTWDARERAQKERERAHEEREQPDEVAEDDD